MKQLINHLIFKGAKKEMKKILYVAIVLIVIFPSLLMAAEEVEIGQVVVTATRTEESVESVASSVTIISETEIEKKKAVNVHDLLKDVEGIDVVQQGGPGHLTSVFIRGGESDHTLVLIDGVQANSPTSGGFDFADLTVDNIERIEIVRGPQSTLYGADAMAGVINIITRKGKGAPSFTLTEEGGTFETYRNSFAVSGSTEKTNYSASLSRMKTEGFSVASEKKGNTEDDGYENKSFSGRLGVSIIENLDADLSIRYTEADTELDSFGTDDPNYTQYTDFLTLSLGFNQILNALWDYSLKLSRADNTLKNRDPDPFGVNSQIESKTDTVILQNNFHFFDDTNTLTIGAEYERQDAKSDSGNGLYKEDLTNKALFIQHQMSYLEEALNFTAGMRRDDHSEFDEETTYKVAASYYIKPSGTKIRGSWGTAYKAPTFNDLYWPHEEFPGFGVISTIITEGNPNITPEESTGYDIGVTQSLFDEKIRIEMAYFKNEYRDLIDWNGTTVGDTQTWMPTNVDDAVIEGWEFGFLLKPVDSFSIKANCTVMDTEDKATGNELARRAKNKGALTIGWTPEKSSYTLTINKVGKRWDDSKNKEELKSYTKIDFAVSYDLTKNLTIFGRGENLLNEDYEEAKGYGTAGISYYGGVKAKF